MKRIRTAISFALMGTLSGVLTAPVTSNAEWVQNPIGVPRAPGCDPGYSWQKLGVRYQCATPQPNCAYGFASGPVWTGTGWNYSCNVPPPPSCPSGYIQQAAPSWNGSAWVGQLCYPGAQQQPPGNPEEACRAYVTKQLGFWPGWGQQNSVFNDGTNTTYITNTYNTSFNTYQYASCSANNSTGAVIGYDVQGYGDTAGSGG
ncbi:Secreted protein (plasmid) [Caballeronia sp. S22]